MARTRHTDPYQALNGLLDQHERAEVKGGASRALTSFVSQSFETTEAEDKFKSVVGSAESAGAVRLEMDKGDLSHLMKRIVLIGPQQLYTFLSRRPINSVIDDTLSDIERTLSDQEKQAVWATITHLSGEWRAGRRPYGLAPSRPADARTFLRVLSAILSRRPEDKRDLRTFSRQETGDSKIIERQETRLINESVRLGRIPDGLSQADAKSALGLEKFPHLVEIAGDWPALKALAGEIGHIGLPADVLVGLEAPRGATLLTIENFASFNRAFRETRKPGLIFLYTGGWPGRGGQAVITHLSKRAAHVYHWGDIDMAGAAIADSVWKASGEKARLHLMEPGLALGKGKPKTFSPVRVDRNSPAAGLIDWLSGPESHALEQEELDPVAPAS